MSMQVQPAIVAADEALVTPVARGVRWGLDRVLAVGYGVVYDLVFERFPPYRALKSEVLAVFERLVPDRAARRSVRILDIACGPGKWSLALAEAGFSTVGVDADGVLIELAREKRRATRFANLSFQEADLVHCHPFEPCAFDHLINIHSLYVHPAPDRLLAEAFRLLKPGGHAVFVNFARRVPLVATARNIHRRAGLGAALRCLLWVLPNSVFEATRRRIGPYYWSAGEFAGHVEGAGFRVLAVRPTFFDDASVLVWATKDET